MHRDVARGEKRGVNSAIHGNQRRIAAQIPAWRDQQRQIEQLARAGYIEHGTAFGDDIARDSDASARQHGACARTVVVRREQRRAGGGKETLRPEIYRGQCNRRQTECDETSATGNGDGATGCDDRAEHRRSLASDGHAGFRICVNGRTLPHHKVATNDEVRRARFEKIPHTHSSERKADWRAERVGQHHRHKLNSTIIGRVSHGDVVLRLGCDLGSRRD